MAGNPEWQIAESKKQISRGVVRREAVPICDLLFAISYFECLARAAGGRNALGRNALRRTTGGPTRLDYPFGYV